MIRIGGSKLAGYLLVNAGEGAPCRLQASSYIAERGRIDPKGLPHFSVDPRLAGRLPYGVSDALTLKPIGFIRTQKRVKFEARHQPIDSEEENNVLELLPGSNFEQALQDLAGFDRVWLLWWFHRNETWRPLVLPPRGPSKRRGVFATRSPHRPNPLGMTPVRLLGVRGRTLILGACDLVDGTPVFDVKPYVPAYDSFPEANAGWIQEVDTTVNAPAEFAVSFAELAQMQADWLRATWEVDFTPRLIELLSRDPSAHRTRRIRKRKSGAFEIGCGAWRAEFSVENKAVTVRVLETGYPLRFLTREGYEDIPDRDAQMAFLERWPDTSPESDAAEIGGSNNADDSDNSPSR